MSSRIDFCKGLGALGKALDFFSSPFSSASSVFATLVAFSFF